MSEENIIFRFDDISLRTSECKLQAMIQFLRERIKNLEIWLAVSPMVHDFEGNSPLQQERVFPSILHTESDYRVFYKGTRIGIPKIIHQVGAVTLAGHGLVHVDHRLLPYAAQELSIVTCCALINSTIFVPPFHKWNEDTEAVCEKHNIHLTRYQQFNRAYLDSFSWQHLAYQKFDPNAALNCIGYYLHTHDFTFEDFCAKFT
jgi:hypothetical protein